MKRWMWMGYGVIACWCLLVWYSGGRVEKGYREEMARLNDREFTYLAIGKSKFERGFLHSEAVTHVSLQPDPCQDAVGLVIREKFRNDPITGGGAIVSDITLEFEDAKLQRLFQKASPDLPPLNLKGRHNFSGRSEYHGDSPAMVIPDDAGGKLNWKGMTLTAFSDRHEQSFQLKSGGLKLSTDNMDMDLKDVSLHSTTRPTAIGLDTGEAEFKVAAFEIDLNSDKLPMLKSITVNDMLASSRLDLRSGKAFSEGTLKVGAMEMGKGRLGLSATVAFNKVDTEAMKELMEAGRKSGRTCHPDTGRLLAALGAIFDGEAELQLKQLDMKIDGKELHMDGVIKGLDFPAGLAERGVQALTDSSSFNGVDLQMKVVTNEAMLMGDTGEVTPRQLTDFRQKALSSGVFQQAGDRFVSNLAFRDGQLTLNGVPWSELFPSRPSSFPGFPGDTLEDGDLTGNDPEMPVDSEEADPASIY
ncbi:MAG TPA: DUF945 family protein [Fluviicoccus sp.]|nr:DUF945 family protein [Fluviicoccus sp.]